MKLSAALFLLACGLTAQSALAQSREDEPPEANPGRPTVSTPATLTPVGYLQFESGFTGTANSPQFSSRCSFNEVMKLSVIRRVELVASAEPIVHSTVGGTTGNSAGEVFVGAQGVLYRGEDARPPLAVSYFHRAYDGPAPEFDFGSPTNSFLVLGSGDVKGFHYDANAFFTELVQEPLRRAQFGQSLSISHALFKNFTVAGGECGRSTARPSGRAERATLDKPPKRMETRFKTTAGDVTLPPGQTQGTVDRIDGIDVRFRVEPVPMRGNLIRERPRGRHAGWPAKSNRIKASHRSGSGGFRDEKRESSLIASRWRSLRPMERGGDVLPPPLSAMPYCAEAPAARSAIFSSTRRWIKRRLRSAKASLSARQVSKSTPTP